jgi:hypothetical protein
MLLLIIINIPPLCKMGVSKYKFFISQVEYSLEQTSLKKVKVQA